MNKILGFSSIEVNKKFASEEEAYKYAKKLKSFIDYKCKKNANKGWYAQAMIVASNIKKEVSLLKNINNGKKGRPRKELVINDYMANGWYKGDYKVDWHLHIILLSKPKSAFSDAIKSYIDKNWINISNIDDKEKIINQKKVYKKNCNIKLMNYFINQSSKRIFCNFNYGEEEKLKYSLKQYFNEYVRLDSAKLKLIKDNIKKPMSEEKYLKRLNKIEERFNDIFNYFYAISNKDNKKMQEDFMQKIMYSKISNNYENVENNIKVQSISRRRNEEEVSF